jgi:hypothetical protein
MRRLLVAIQQAPHIIQCAAHLKEKIQSVTPTVVVVVQHWLYWLTAKILDAFGRQRDGFRSSKTTLIPPGIKIVSTHKL